MKEQLLQTGYTWGRQVVLRCQARYPQLEAGELPGLEGVLSQYYAAYARDKINNLARGWYPAACASCRRMGPYGGFSPLEAQCEYTVMYNRGGYYSAFFDTYVRQDGRDLAAGRQSGVFRPCFAQGIRIVRSFCDACRRKPPAKRGGTQAPFMWIGPRW